MKRFMKRFIATIICCLMIFPVKGQIRHTQIRISYDAKQLSITNNTIQSELENVIFENADTVRSRYLNEYKYFHLYVEEHADYQEFLFRLSNWPENISNDVIGYFVLRDHLVFVHQVLPDFLEYGGGKKRFTYERVKIGHLYLDPEDDTPLWIFEYRDSQLKLTHYPGMYARSR